MTAMLDGGGGLSQERPAGIMYAEDAFGCLAAAHIARDSMR